VRDRIKLNSIIMIGVSTFIIINRLFSETIIMFLLGASLVWLFSNNIDCLCSRLLFSLFFNLLKFLVLLRVFMRELLILSLLYGHFSLELVRYWLILFLLLSKKSCVFQQLSILIKNLNQSLITKWKRFAHSLETRKQLILVVYLCIKWPLQLDI